MNSNVSRTRNQAPGKRAEQRRTEEAGITVVGREASVDGSCVISVGNMQLGLIRAPEILREEEKIDRKRRCANKRLHFTCIFPRQLKARERDVFSKLHLDDVNAKRTNTICIPHLCSLYDRCADCYQLAYTCALPTITLSSDAMREWIRFSLAGDEWSRWQSEVSIDLMRQVHVDVIDK